MESRIKINSEEATWLMHIIQVHVTDAVIKGVPVHEFSARGPLVAKLKRIAETHSA